MHARRIRPLIPQFIIKPGLTTTILYMEQFTCLRIRARPSIRIIFPIIIRPIFTDIQYLITFSLTMKSIAVRIKDIAEKAGVSTGTVDRVLHKRGKVAPDVERRVLRVLNDMNYEPNLIARALGSNKTYKIAALIPDPAY